MVEGRTDALQLIIEQRDQILAEKNSELKMKTSEVDAFATQVWIHHDHRSPLIAVYMSIVLRCGHDNRSHDHRSLLITLLQVEDTRKKLKAVEEKLKEKTKEAKSLKEELDCAKNESRLVTKKLFNR